MSLVKYIFITGGVVSGLGKGITAAAIGRLLKDRGFKVTIQKFDPYINVDSGTMSPYQHGEVFVTSDGTETDLDLGHYERFIDEDLNVDSNITTGKLYWNVINKERSGCYLGKTVQVIPHITNEIKDKIYSAGKTSGSDIVITEIGGTVGDIEGQPFLEAIRQIGSSNFDDVLYIHLTLIPVVPGSFELKSKPTQHSVKELLSFGIRPAIIVCRTDFRMTDEMIDKIGLFCNVASEDVIQNLTADSIYEVPVMFENSGFADRICYHLKLGNCIPNNGKWLSMLKKMRASTSQITIGLVGKYVELPDAYISVVESLKHGGIYNDVKVNVKYINSQVLDRNFTVDVFSDCDGIIVPGGFGDRGIEGKIRAIKYCREKNLPCFGICLGMQLMVIEFARNVVKLEDANSTEFDCDCVNNVIDIMQEQKEIDKKGGTMRLGSYPCSIASDSICFKIYNENLIYERHRHRFEVNIKYRSVLEEAGLKFAGLSPDGSLTEMVELSSNKWFIGVQFHPEFRSRPNKPHPLFLSFVNAASIFKLKKQSSISDFGLK